MARINWLEVQCFRAFGKEAQRLDLTGPVSVVWASNSTGKTSLAEAFEFLLTGATVRRELTASAKDEFSDSLRNVHVPASTACVVAAEIVDDAGTAHVVKRTLVSDYAKKSPCASGLTIDGEPAAEAALAALGVRLSQPPLSAPILMQHTLSYLFSASPQDRALYFKALLEVTDLDELREEIAQAAVVDTTPSPELKRLQLVAQHPVLRPALGAVVGRVFSAVELEQALSATAAAVLASAGEAAPAAAPDRFARVKALLSARRSSTFPLDDFQRRPVQAWVAPASTSIKPLEDFRKQAGEVDEQVKQLLSLFQAALQLPELSGATTSVDCPLCETASGLSLDRIAAIRETLQKTEAFQASRRAAAACLQQLDSTVGALATSAPSAVPSGSRLNDAEATKRGFTAARMRSLLPAESHPLIDSWYEGVAAVRTAAEDVSTKVAATKALIAKFVKEPASCEIEPSTVLDAVQEVASSHSVLRGCSEALVEPEGALLAALRNVVDRASNTEGWQDLLDIVGKESVLAAASLDRKVAEDVAADFAKALKDIDAAKEKVLAKKFSDLSADVQSWWELLRPGEPTFFAELGPRPKTRRTVDFKAGLAADGNRTTVATRDAIAVFSHSQLQCLGLAAFLARASRENIGFVILDDPVLSSDEDHWPSFARDVVQRLAAAGVQTVVLTQERKLRDDLSLRYSHLGIDNFRITREDPVRGATLVKTSDEIAELLDRATAFIGNTNPDIRKQGSTILRDATERLCKELLVRDNHKNGDATAKVADYDGKTLGVLRPKAEALLNLDSAHPGKLRAVEKALNPGSHDDDAPAAGVLKVALGDLKQLKKDYL